MNLRGVYAINRVSVSAGFVGSLMLGRCVDDKALCPAPNEPALEFPHTHMISYVSNRGYVGDA